MKVTGILVIVSTSVVPALVVIVAAAAPNVALFWVVSPVTEQPIAAFSAISALNVINRAPNVGEVAITASLVCDRCKLPKEYRK
jgi:hypothetical protein